MVGLAGNLTSAYLGSAAIVVPLRNICVACSSAEQFGCCGAGKAGLCLAAVMLFLLVKLKALRNRLGLGTHRGLKLGCGQHAMLCVLVLCELICALIRAPWPLPAAAR